MDGFGTLVLSASKPLRLLLLAASTAANHPQSAVTDRRIVFLFTAKTTYPIHRDTHSPANSTQTLVTRAGLDTPGRRTND
jgi:hypothetical protein